MKAVLEKFNKEEAGALSVIEMTLIFPLVLVTVGFLIYLGIFMLQTITLYNDAQRIAVIASKEAAMPGYTKLYGGQNISTKADFNWSESYVPGAEIVNAVMQTHKPYRYWSSNFIDSSVKESLEESLEKLVTDTSLINHSIVECTITTTNNVISQAVQVRIVKRINVPEFLSLLGITNAFDIDVTATAVVGDVAEFVRNVNMVFDLTDFLFDELHIGESGKTINERIGLYKQKFNDMAHKLGFSF